MANPNPDKTKEATEALETTPVHPDLNAIPTRRRFLRALRDGDGLIVRRRLQRKGMRLNRTASIIWSMCDGQRSVASILVVLRRTFSGTDRSLVQEVLATLNSLADQRLLKFRKVPQGAWGQRQIDLREITFYVINCETDESRRESMERQLSELDLKYELVVGTKCDPGWIGCAISHLRILNRDQIKPPFAVLEDDCRFNDNFRYEFTVPSNADALYLGVSNWGIEVPGELSWGKFDGVQWSRYDANNLRVFNMLAAHAILYLSDAFHRAARTANVEALANPDYSFLGDVGMASIQPSHLVLTPLEPICYQDSELGGDQGATMHPLAEVEKRRVEESEAQNEASNDDGET